MTEVPAAAGTCSARPHHWNAFLQP